MKRYRVERNDWYYRLWVWKDHDWQQMEVLVGGKEKYNPSKEEAIAFGEQWEKENPFTEKKRVVLLVSYPERNYGIMEKAEYEEWEERYNFPNSPLGWDAITKNRAYLRDSFYKSNGSESRGPKFKIVLVDKKWNGSA